MRGEESQRANAVASMWVFGIGVVAGTLFSTFSFKSAFRYVSFFIILRDNGFLASTVFYNTVGTHRCCMHRFYDAFDVHRKAGCCKLQAKRQQATN